MKHIKTFEEVIHRELNNFYLFEDSQSELVDQTTTTNSTTSPPNKPRKLTPEEEAQFHIPPKLPNNKQSSSVKGDLPYMFTKYKWLKGWYKNGPTRTALYFNNNSEEPCKSDCLCQNIVPPLDVDEVGYQGWWTVKNNKFHFQEVPTGNNQKK